MKRVFIAVLSLSISFSAIAQKKELKKVEKLIKSGKKAEATALLTSLTDKVKDTEYETYLTLLQGKNEFGKNDVAHYPEALVLFKEVLSKEAQSEDKEYSKDALGYIKLINADYIKSIGTSLKAKDYQKLATSYEEYASLYPERRDVLVQTLYSYQQAKNNVKTLEIGNALIAKDTQENYYTSVNKQTKNEDQFFEKSDRDASVANGIGTEPKEVKADANERINFYNILVGVYFADKNYDKALEVLAKGKENFPKHIKFYEDYATTVLEKGDDKAYVTATEDLTKVKPNDKNVWVNLGLANQKVGNIEAAKQAFDKAVEIDPTYAGAHTSKALAILSEEKAIITEMNNNLRNKAKYDAANTRLTSMYTEAIGAFENSYAIKQDAGIKATLINLYKATKQDAKISNLK